MTNVVDFTQRWSEKTRDPDELHFKEHIPSDENIGYLPCQDCGGFDYVMVVRQDFSDKSGDRVLVVCKHCYAVGLKVEL